MNATHYPENRAEANAMLRNLSHGLIDMPLHMIRYCLLMTGDLS